MKRVIALSDVHGASGALSDAYALARRTGPVDVAVFLGDGADKFDDVRSQWEAQGTKCYAVAGNNDWSCYDPQEITFQVCGVRFYACHGHTRYVKYGLDRLWYSAREKEAQVALYGHTHVAKIDLEYGMHIINPGAICERRSGAPAFAEILVHDNGAVIPSIVRWE